MRNRRGGYEATGRLEDMKPPPGTPPPVQVSQPTRTMAGMLLRDDPELERLYLTSALFRQRIDQLVFGLPATVDRIAAEAREDAAQRARRLGEVCRG